MLKNLVNIFFVLVDVTVMQKINCSYQTYNPVKPIIILSFSMIGTGGGL